MSREALSILECLTSDSSKRQKRLTRLLKPADAEHANGWFMCVPSCFNNSLDIRRTERSEGGRKALVWTQGSAFSFAEGDVIYDTLDDERPWSDALKKLSLCVQVRRALSAQPPSEQAPRFPGSITFDVLKPDKSGTEIVKLCQHIMSQDDFVRFLIAGPSGELADKLNTGKPE